METFGRMFFLLIVIGFSLLGCVPDSMPLKGTYDSASFQITTAKSVDGTWAIIADLFTAHGLEIQTLDKKNGLITTSETPFIATYTFEDQNGKLEVPEAWIVLRRAENNDKQKWIPKSIYGTWSIQITAGERGTTLKLDPTVLCTYYPNRFTSIETHEQSTGNLEEQIRAALAGH